MEKEPKIGKTCIHLQDFVRDCKKLVKKQFLFLVHLSERQIPLDVWIWEWDPYFRFFNRKGLVLILANVVVIPPSNLPCSHKLEGCVELSGYECW